MPFVTSDYQCYNYFAFFGDLACSTIELPAMPMFKTSMNKKMQKALGSLQQPKVKKLLAPLDYASSTLPQRVTVQYGEWEVTGLRVRRQ